uniref:Protein phosphatase 1 regulatory subunit 12B n=1 Tax=Stomoxys calcitrans TaxID=35570 RepID=A0A1I8PGL0_STOCA
MTSLDIRNNSAVNKRAEQLKRWEESDTNQQPPVPRPERGSRIKFSSGCIFLAACLAGDKDEVLKLLEQGADINTANVDGLTALHQACIDDNLEMVEFLVEQGADINRQDNEGWTPLHATASCGFVSIARYLVEHGADVAAVNSDGDLAVDLAVDIQHLPMIDFMQKMVAEQQIDCAKARQAEQQQMLTDAKKWLRSDASEVDRPHPKTGATALHVAAAKGYTKVLSLLLAGRANVDAQDNDGWTPLHAAAHWGQKEAAEMLLDAMADMDVRNYAGQTCIDVAERKMVKYLEEYRANNKRIKRRPSSQISRISDTIENHMDKTPPKIIRVEVRPENNKDHANVSTCVASTSGYSGSSGGSSLPTNSESEETDSDLTDSTESSHSTSLSEPDEEDDKSSVQKTANDAPATEDEAPWRRNNVSRVRSAIDSPSKNLPDVIDVKKTTPTNATATETTDVILRRTQSFENDEKFYQKYNELRARIKANSCPVIPATLQQHHQQQQQQQQQQQYNNVNNNHSINNNLNNNSNINLNSTSCSSSSCNNTTTTSTATTISPTTPSNNTIIINTTTTTSSLPASTTITAGNNTVAATHLPSAATTTGITPADNSFSPASNLTSPSYTTSYSSFSPTSPTYTVQRSASLKDHKQIFIRKSPSVTPAVSSTPAYSNTTNTSSPATVTTPIRSTQTQPQQVAQNSPQTKDNNKATANNNNNNNNNTSNGSTADPVKAKQSTGNMIKNFFKSFVPPVRDEESETQRKAHAKRVRETRRSTQGVTLDEIKSAEELVKKKNSTMNNNNNNNNSSNNETQANVVEPSEAATAIPIPTAATATTTTTNNEQNSKEAEISTDPTKSEEDTNTKASNDGGGTDNDDDDDNVTSFTIIAPSAANRSRPSSLIVTAKTTTISSKSAAMAAEEVEDAQEEVSATFVMPPRKDSRTPTPTSKTETATENVETTIVITSPKRTANKAITDDEKDRQREEKVNQETEKGEHKEDEQEDDEEDAGIKPDKKTEPPPLEGMVVTTSAAEAPRVPSPTTQRAHTNERMRAAFFSPLPLAEPIAASNQNKPPSATTTPTLESPVRLRDKRSLFDMDNASSQTLADKLRQETHRYGYDEKRGGIFAGESSISAATLNQPSHVAHSVHESSTDRDSSMSPLFCNLGPIPGLGYASRRSLDSSSASLPNSPLHTRDREAGGNDQAGHHNNGANANAADRRPSWRLKFDAGSKFKLEDVNAGNTYHPPTNSTIIPSAPAVIAAANSMSQRRITSVNNAMSSSNQSLNSIGRPVSAPPTSNLSNSSNTSSSITSSSISQKNDEKSHENSSNTNPTATSSTSTSSSGIGSSSASSYAARRASANTSATAALNAETPSGAASATSTTSSSLSNNDDKDNDKENDNRSALATQAVIQRRRKPKRRSTGVVHIDMDELDPEKQDSANDTEDKEKESGGESRGSRSRAGSTVSVSTSTTSATDDKKTRDKTENSGDNIDYKALWEAVKLENDKLKQQLKKKDEEVVQTRATLERFANATNKNSLSEIEKRERRAMERKLSELEEELKLLQKLKNENERLRAENRALTRVVSKLTSSAQSQLSKANNKQ